MRRARTFLALALGGMTVAAIAVSRSQDAPVAAHDVVIDSLAIATASLPGSSPVDTEIRRLQEAARRAPGARGALERLGWAFVTRARETGDAGYYRLAEHASLALQDLDPPAATLLEGHVAHALHRFEEAEALARRAVAERGLAFDHALLGDVLFDRGDVEGAIASYQEMLDQRPDASAQVRAARVRHLRGDVEGSLQALRDAARAVGPRHRESYAWVRAELALREFEAGDLVAARRHLGAALEVAPSHPRALALEGRVLLAQGRADEAVASLERAAARTDLPDVLWALVEALDASGRDAEARAAEARLRDVGERSDARGFSLYLATRGVEPERALRLARAEMVRRRDVYSFDALAWSELAVGDVAGAREHVARALAEGTRDARIFLHAGVIAARSGAESEARSWLAKARSLDSSLLPSEQALLRKQLLALSAASL